MLATVNISINTDAKPKPVQVDLDKSGGISFGEFVMMMRLGDMETDFEKEINGAFKFFDKNNDGMVSYEYEEKEEEE